MTRLLITTNNFWVGGRETYLASWLEADEAVEPILMASSIQSDAPGLACFADTVEVGGDETAGRWLGWLQKGGAQIDRRRPAVIWAHHFDLLPAWLLSRAHGIPLLTTFHGPLIDADRPNEAIQALGMTLAIHRGEFVSGVSPEVCSDLETLGRPGARLIPNVVRFNPDPTRPSFPPRQFVLITRRQKLEHIRQGVLLFCAYASRTKGAHLVVVDGDSSVGFQSRTRAAVERLRRALRQLGRKWILRQGLPVMRHLAKIEFIGWTDDSSGLIRQSDLVLGMGRVALEAVSEARPAVLIGYEQLHGFLTTATFDQFRQTNFSGRLCEVVDRARLAERLATATESPDLSTLGPMIDVEAQAQPLRDELDKIAESTVAEASRGEMATELVEVVRRGGCDAEIVQVAMTMMTQQELETFRRLEDG